MPPVSRTLLKVLAAVLVPLSFFGLLEGILRLTPWSEELGPARYYGGLEDHSMFWDPDRVIKYFDDEDRIKGEFRGKKTAMARPPGAYRVITLGGSFTYGWPYNDKPEVAYAARLQALLNSRGLPPGKQVEVLNAGFGGYTSFQALHYFSERLYRFKPDLVTICFGANDGNSNESIGLNITDREYYHRMNKIGASPMLSAVKHFLDQLRLYGLVEKVTAKIRNSLREPTQRVPPDHFRENLQQFLALAKKHDFRLLLIGEPHRHMTRFAAEVEVNPYFNIMADIASKHPDRVRMVDIVTDLLKPPRDEIFYDFMHLTPRGHGLAAEAIAAQLQESGFLK